MRKKNKEQERKNKREERKRDAKGKNERVKEKGEQSGSKEKEGKRMTLFAGEKKMREALHDMRPLYLLMCKESLFLDSDLNSSLLTFAIAHLQEYKDVFLEEMPPGLPPLRGIEHQINFVPGAQIPNKPVYEQSRGDQEALKTR
ncbi:uncharacterized protein LOC131170250 [Hevea brasiliensis]|uniref:uncharacterized protein LOC131170250 n=1 Tax=Hevea brasiliensis TaxID=3981 RepID=UPI0025D89A80|nr:uncharacterized protein LOC131170250 [Hevea brasiliensis]